MKKILPLLILMFSISVFCQKKELEIRQKEKYDEALYSIVGNTELSFRIFSFTYKMNPKSKVGKEALKKYDSLKSVLRSQLKKEIKGNWIMIKSIGDYEKEKNFDSIQHFLSITDNKIEFSEKKSNEKNKQITEIEKLFFNDTQVQNSVFNDIKYSNDIVWKYSIDYENNTLVVLLDGEIKKEKELIHWKNVGYQKYVYRRLK